MRYLCFLLFILFAGNGFGQNSIPEYHDAVTGVSVITHSYHKTFDNDGNVKPSLHIRQQVYELYGEYGFAAHFNAFIRIPYVHNVLVAEGPVPGLTVSGMGDMDAGARYRLNAISNLHISFYVMQSLGFNNDKKMQGLNTGYGDFSQAAGVAARYSRERLQVQGEGGFRNRNRGYGDEINGKAELAFMLVNNVWIYALSEGVQPLENGDDKKTGGVAGLFAQYEGYWNSGGGIRLALKRWEFAAATYGNYKGQYSPSGEVFKFEIRYLVNGASAEE